MTSKELREMVAYANSLADTNEDRKRVITKLLVNAKGDELKDLDMNTLTWLLGGLDKAEKEGKRAPLKPEHLVIRAHDHRKHAEINPQVTVRSRHQRGINAASETTETDRDPDDLPETWVGSKGEVLP